MPHVYWNISFIGKAQFMEMEIIANLTKCLLMIVINKSQEPLTLFPRENGGKNLKTKKTAMCRSHTIPLFAFLFHSTCSVILFYSISFIILFYSFPSIPFNFCYSDAFVIFCHLFHSFAAIPLLSFYFLIRVFSFYHIILILAFFSVILFL